MEFGVPANAQSTDLTPKWVSAGTKRSASGCNSLRGKVLPSSVHVAELNQGIAFCEAAFFLGGGGFLSVQSVLADFTSEAR